MKKASDLLRQTREAKKLTLEEVEDATKIKKIYLSQIEDGNFSGLPSESYAQGFVKNYAKFLDLPLSTIVPLYRREYDANKSIPIIPEFRKTQAKFNQKFIFSPRGFIIVMAIFFVGLYVFFQYSSLIFAPSLTIDSPKENQKIASNVVKVVGKTDPYANVFIDEDEVYVGIDGKFEKSVYKFSGDEKITVVAKNRFGKESKKVVDVKIE